MVSPDDVVQAAWAIRAFRGRHGGLFQQRLLSRLSTLTRRHEPAGWRPPAQAVEVRRTVAGDTSAAAVSSLPITRFRDQRRSRSHLCGATLYVVILHCNV